MADEKVVEAIKVALRVRPSKVGPAHLQSEDTVSAVQIDGTTATIGGNVPKAFAFDYAYDGGTQEDIFDDVGSILVQSALNGFNCSLFAYGQTGSGKSFTVLGMRDQPGLVPRAVASIFNKKAEYEENDDKEIIVLVSFVEIYNERVKDLLSKVDQPAQELKIIDHPKFGSCIPNLTEVLARSQDDIQQLLAFGAQKRVTAATQMNAQSSRSHAVFTLKVQQLEGPKPQPGAADIRRVLHSKMNLADLAGSERQAKTGAEGLRLKEGSAINQSLSTLALIIKNLSENADKDSLHQTKVAFRASKLTFLLKDSLVGNSRSCMMACVSPASSDISETMSTLRFASSVKKIKTSAVQNKEASRDEVMEGLQAEIKKLKDQLMHAEREDESNEVSRLRGLLDVTSNQYHDDLAQETPFIVSNDLISQALHVDKGTPYLLNMSDDPLIAGCLLYYLCESEVTRIGAAEDNKIVLKGLGISSCLCEVQNIGNSELTIRKNSAEGRLCVNGKLIQPAQGALRLRQSDKIYFGRVFAFKLMVPTEGSSPSHRGSLIRHTNTLALNGLEHEWTAIEESTTWDSLEQYFRQVATQLPPDQADLLYEDLKKGWLLCEEATEITAQCRSSEKLSFEVDMTSSIPSSVVIRVRQDDCSNGQEMHNLLYIWSVPKLAERVERMKDCYEEYMFSGKKDVDPLLDPWHEAHPGVIERRLNELGIMVQAEREHFERMRAAAANSISKHLSIWLEDNKEGKLRAAFTGWLTAVKASKMTNGTSESQKQSTNQARITGAGPAAVRSTPLRKERTPSFSAGNSRRPQRRAATELSEQIGPASPSSSSTAKVQQDSSANSSIFKPLSAKAQAAGINSDPTAAAAADDDSTAESVLRAENTQLRRYLEETKRLCEVLTQRIAEMKDAERPTQHSSSQVRDAGRPPSVQRCSDDRQPWVWPVSEDSKSVSASVRDPTSPSYSAQSPVEANHAHLKYIGTTTVIHPASQRSRTPSVPVHARERSTTPRGLSSMLPQSAVGTVSPLSLRALTGVPINMNGPDCLHPGNLQIVQPTNSYSSNHATPRLITADRFQFISWGSSERQSAALPGSWLAS